jgi:hypothetical protein
MALHVASVKNMLQQEVFSPFKIAKLIDLNGWKMNLQTFDILRQLEVGNNKYVRNTMIPESTAIKRVMTQVNKLGKLTIPFTVLDSMSHEAVRFDFPKALGALIKAFCVDAMAMG